MRRKIISKLIFFCFIFFLATDISFAAGMIARVQQMKAMKQRQAQGITEEQYQAQQQQQGNQPQNPQAPAQPTYQQTVDERNTAIAQAILNAHSQTVSTGDQLGNMQGAPGEYQASNNAIARPMPASLPQAPQQTYAPALSSDINQTVDISEVWKKLDKKSTVWTLLSDDQDKILTVSEYIDRFHKEGVKINEPPLHYVQMIDQIVKENPQILQRPFGELVQIVAIVDYDFDNGMDKDDLARKILGEAAFEVNKKRLTGDHH